MPQEYMLCRCRAPGCFEIFTNWGQRLSHERLEHNNDYKGERGYSTFFATKFERDEAREGLVRIAAQMRQRQVSDLKDTIKEEIDENNRLKIVEAEKKAKAEQLQEIIFEVPKEELESIEKENANREAKPKPVVVEKVIEQVKNTQVEPLDQQVRQINKKQEKTEGAFIDKFNAWLEGDEL